MKAKVYPDQEFLNERFYYNEETGDLIWKKRPASHFSRRGVMASWNGKNAGNIAGSLLRNKKTGKKYLQTGINGKLYLNHRLIYIILNGSLNVDEQIDHVDGDGLNNRKLNIRLVCGYSENNKNRRLQENNTSGVNGVNWSESSNKWIVRIGIGDKVRKALGSFNNLDDAIKARHAADIKYNFHENHGEERPL